MKKLKRLFTNALIYTLFSFQISAQSPTLSAGLDNVAFKKGTLDVELITKIISEKQKELIKEGIKRMIFEFIGDSRLDDYSQFYIERITEILFQEKNHKVMTKRILEESTNYLFILGTTKLVLESKNLELKNLFLENKFSEFPTSLKEINNLEQRNKIIKTILTICSEIPEIKKLGLLNNFNYYEHSKIYEKRFLKNLITANKLDFNVLDTINKNNEFKDCFNEILIKNNYLKNESIISDDIDFTAIIKKTKENNSLKIKELKSKQTKINNNIKILRKNKYSSFFLAGLFKKKKASNNLKMFLKEQKKIKKNIKDSIKSIEKKVINFKEKMVFSNSNNDSITYLAKKISKSYKGIESLFIEREINNILRDIKHEPIQLNSEAISNYVKSAIKIKEFIKGVLSKSNILKDILNNSGINFDIKKDSLSIVYKNYKNLINDSYDIDQLIFKSEGNKIDSANFRKIENYKNEVQILQELSNKYDHIKLKKSINNINTKVNKYKNIINEYIKISKKLKKDTLTDLDITEIKGNVLVIGDKALITDIKSSNFAVSKKVFLDKIKEKSVAQMNKIEKFLKNEKDSIFFKTIDTLSNYQSLNNQFKKDNYKLIIDDLKTYDEEIVKFKNHMSSIKKQYNKARQNYKYIQIINILHNNDSLDDFMKKLDKNESLNNSIIEYNKKEWIKKLNKNKSLNNSIIEHYKKEWIKKLDTKLTIKEYVTPNKIISKSILLLKELEGKYLVENISNGDYSDLFKLIKKYLIKDIKLINGVILSKREEKIIKKLYSFFLDRNMKDKIEDLENLSFFSNEFLGELALLSNKFESTTTDDNDNTINKLIASIEFSTSVVLSNKIEENKKFFNQFTNINKLTDFLKFIGNIKELNKAETFSFLLKTMNDYEYLFRGANGGKKIIPDLINSLREYSIVDLDNNSIEIDVASVLTHLLEKYQNESSNWSFYATVGLNQNWAPNGNLIDNDGNTYTNFNTASEKIGAKLKMWNFNRRPLFEDKLFHNVKRKALVSDIYVFPYVSGILYKIADTSGKGYNSANIGAAIGLTFFNSLDFNISASLPMEGQVFKNPVFGFSFDIPLSEYLKRL